jgi:hypothetical protein
VQFIASSKIIIDKLIIFVLKGLAESSLKLRGAYGFEKIAHYFIARLSYSSFLQLCTIIRYRCMGRIRDYADESESERTYFRKVP